MFCSITRQCSKIIHVIQLWILLYQVSLSLLVVQSALLIRVLSHNAPNMTRVEYIQPMLSLHIVWVYIVFLFFGLCELFYYVWTGQSILGVINSLFEISTCKLPRNQRILIYLHIFIFLSSMMITPSSSVWNSFNIQKIRRWWREKKNKEKVKNLYFCPPTPRVLEEEVKVSFD